MPCFILRGYAAWHGGRRCYYYQPFYLKKFLPLLAFEPKRIGHPIKLSTGEMLCGGTQGLIDLMMLVLWHKAGSFRILGHSGTLRPVGKFNVFTRKSKKRNLLLLSL
jgi:hypothetical protein